MASAAGFGTGAKGEDRISEMIIPGFSHWNRGLGRQEGDVDKDEEGIRTMTVLGENMAWLLKKVG